MNKLSGNIEKEYEIDLIDQIGKIYRHKIFIVIVTMIAAIGVLAFTLISKRLPAEKSPYPNLFKPVSTVRINSSNGGGGLSSILESSDLGVFAGLIGASSGGSTETGFAISLAYSNTVIDQISKEFNLRTIYGFDDSGYPVTSTRNAVKSRLIVEEDAESGSILISYKDIYPELATKIVNKVVNILETRFFELSQSSNQSQRILLEQKISDSEQEISILKQEIYDFQTRYSLFDAKSLAKSVSEKIVTLRTSLAEKEAAINTYKLKNRIQDPILISLLDQKKAIENLIFALENGTVEGIPSLKDLPLIVMEYEELTRNLEVKAFIYKTIYQQYEILKLQNGGSGPKFQIIEYAEIPEMKSEPNRGKLCIIITVLAFFLSIFIIFLKEIWVKINKDPNTIKRLKGKI